MTDHLDALRCALQEAAAREYPARRAPRRAVARRRSPAVALGAAVAALVVAAVLAVGRSAPPAYALVTHADGSVTVTLHDLVTAPARLNARFAALGLRERILPMTGSCRTEALAAGTVTRSELTNLPFTFTVGRQARGHGGPWGYLAIRPTTGGRFLYAQGWRSGPPSACFPMVESVRPRAR